MVIKKPAAGSTNKTTSKKPTSTSTGSSTTTVKKPASGSTNSSISIVKKPTPSVGSTANSSSDKKKSSSGGSSSKSQKSSVSAGGAIVKKPLPALTSADHGERPFGLSHDVDHHYRSNADDLDIVTMRDGAGLMPMARDVSGGGGWGSVNISYVRDEKGRLIPLYEYDPDPLPFGVDFLGIFAAEQGLSEEQVAVLTEIDLSTASPSQVPVNIYDSWQGFIETQNPNVQQPILGFLNEAPDPDTLPPTLAELFQQEFAGTSMLEVSDNVETLYQDALKKAQELWRLYQQYIAAIVAAAVVDIIATITLLNTINNNRMIQEYFDLVSPEELGMGSTVSEDPLPQTSAEDNIEVGPQQQGQGLEVEVGPSGEGQEPALTADSGFTLLPQQGLIINEARQFLPEEQPLVDYLRETGHEVEPLDEPSDSTTRSPDSLVDGVRTELKWLYTATDDTYATSDTVRNSVNNSLRRGGQARNIIIDARGSGLTLEEAERGIRRVAGITRGRLDSLVIVGDDFEVRGDYNQNSTTESE